MIRIWQAHACNNSSAYRIVARFADPAVAADAAREIGELFATHAREIDNDPRDAMEPSQAQRALAAKYGFAWPGVMLWGRDQLTGLEPLLFAAGTVVVVLHDHCTGLGGLHGYCEARGATVEVSDDDRGELPPMLASVLFAWSEPLEIGTGGQGFSPRAAFQDGATVGICVELDNGSLESLPNLRRWLAERGVERPSITLCDDNDALAFPLIATARCSACSGPLCYLDPRIHDIERAQLVCRPCGGLYELEVLLEDR